MKTKFIAAILAVVALGASAFAATVPTPLASNSSLLLGFSETNSANTGFGSSLEVYIGDAATFFNQTPGTTVTIAQLNVADLVSTYGSNWNTSSTLLWGVAGTNGSTAGLRTLYGTQIQDGVIPVARVGTQQSAPASALLTVYTDFTGKTSTGTAGTSDSATVRTGASDWTGKLGSTASAFGFTSWGTLEFQNNVTAASNVSDLYKFTPTASGTAPAVLGGSFALSSGGVLTFTAASAIPEPSTYAAIFGVAMLGFAVSRRRIQKKA